MPHHHRPARALPGAAAAAALLLTACAGHAAGHPGTASPTPTTRTSAATDPATAARKTEYTQIQAQMKQAVGKARLSGDAVANLHPNGSLTGTPYCLDSLLLLVPNDRATQVATTLEHTMQAGGWTADTTTSPGTIALDHGDWTVTITHQTSGNDTDPTTGTIRTGPMTFFQAKNNNLNCT